MLQKYRGQYNKIKKSDHWKWWGAHGYDLIFEMMAEPGWSLKRIKILEQFTLLNSTLKVRVNRRTKRTGLCFSLYIWEEIPLGNVDKTCVFFLKQTSSLPKLTFSQMSHRCSMSPLKYLVKMFQRNESWNSVSSVFSLFCLSLWIFQFILQYTFWRVGGAAGKGKVIY